MGNVTAAKTITLHLSLLHTHIIMSDIVVPGFKASELIAELNKAFEGFSDEERAKLIKQVRKSCHLLSRVYKSC